LSAQSGAPFTVNLGVDQANIGAGPAQRPDQLRNANLPAAERTPERWFDTSAFALQAPFTFGNAPRTDGRVRTPMRRNWDMSIEKSHRLAGRTIAVTTADHVLMNLEFVNGGLGQLLASFAAPSTQAPWLELHYTNGTISFAGESSDKDAPASIYFDDDSPLGLEGWVHGLLPPPPGDELGAVESGAVHFVACLRGDEGPILTAEQARHVLDIILKAYLSIEDGLSHETETTI